jgi:hypothetical protein
VLPFRQMRIAPSAWFGTATTFAFGAVGFWLFGLVSATLAVLCFVCAAIAALCLAAAFREHYIRIGEINSATIGRDGEMAITGGTPLDRLAPSHSGAVTGGVSDEPTPNVVAVLAHGGRVHVDHSSNNIKSGDGTRFDTPYFAAIVPYRNEPSIERKVGDAFNVKARIAVGNQAYPVTGYWLQSDRDHISLPVGGSAQKLVVALKDREGNVYIVDDHRDENNYRPAELLMLWTPKMIDEAFSVEIQLFSAGTVLVEDRYTLAPRPLDLDLA